MRMKHEPPRASRGAPGGVADHDAGRATAALSGTLAIVCIVVIAANLRPAIVSAGAILPVLQRGFGISHATSSLLISLPDICMGALALPSAWLARRFGRDRMIHGALVVLFLATALRALSPGLGAMMITTTAIGAGIAIAGTLIGSYVKQAYRERIGLLMGLYSMGLSLGSTVAAAATGSLAERVGGWSIPLGIWSLPLVAAIAAWHVLARGTRAEPVQERADAIVAPFRMPAAWLIGVYNGVINFLFYALLSWIVPMYAERGSSTADASFLLATFIGCVAIGSLALGLLSRQEDRRSLLASSACCAVLGLVSAIGLLPLPAWAAVSMIGLDVGGGSALGMTLPLDHARDAREAASWSGFVLTVGYLIAATGPVVIGWVRDATGGFSAALWILLGVSMVMLAVTPTLRPPSQRLAKAVGGLNLGLQGGEDLP